jgi:ABC-type multidrug transport system fused ATPase/permease subunit
MKETSDFVPIQGEIKRAKKVTKIEPITASEHENMEERPMSVKDYWMSLRSSIQEKLTIEKPTAEEQERIKLLSELISPELVKEYRQILGNFNKKTQKSKEHPREFIDVNEKELSGSIDVWIDNLIAEIKSKRETDFDIEELRAECWLLFDSIGCVMNTKSLEGDIADFYKGKIPDETEKKEQERQKSELVKELQSRYPLSKIEIEILVDLIKSDGNEDENYSLKILTETITRLWKEYNLGEKKGTIAKISLGYLISKGAESFAPSLFQSMIVQDKFNIAVFIEFFGLRKLSGIVDAKIEIELVKVMNEVNHKINERIVDSLFFQEFEFIHEKSLGEIYSTLGRGKVATEEILREVISEFAPSLTGIVMSLVFLTKINPALGVISIGSLPIMYQIAKKQNEQIWPIQNEEMRRGEEIATRIESIKSGFELVRTSPETSSIASHTKEQMNAKDTLSLRRSIEEIKMRLKNEIPFDASTVVAAGVGSAFQQSGMISGGAVLSTILYSGYLTEPIKKLVELYFTKFSRHIQDIQRMEEILGGYEKLDLPEGKKEDSRIPVSSLENFDISIRNLQYKNILQGVNIDIKQGEFVTITGASGAGKSTMLRNLVGLYKPDGGEITIGGVKNDEVKKYGKESLYSVMSYCNQSPQIFEGMTLRENLLLWSKEAVDDERIKKVLRDLHLDKFIDKLDVENKHFSQGEKVRIGVARTLIKGAKIMLLDEPTASLDSQASTEVRKIIGEINKKYPDTTIVCVSHDEDLIKSSTRSVNISELTK